MDRYIGEDSIGPAPAEPDQELREFVVSRVNEAAERVSFHDREAERWRRIGRAAGAAVLQLDSHDPVAVTTAEHFVEQQAKSVAAQQAPAYPHN